MPLIHVNMIEGRPDEKKEELIQELTKTASDVLNAPINSVRVLITELPATHWGVAGQSMAEIRKSKK